ncbi:hypothetical protein PflCFBP13517_18245 [Pseudomonas fluorescens]|nr:hypothetical protein PflCFBP13517_18245 [Pseudomonas fluorescens]
MDIPQDVAGRELKVGQLVAHTERAQYRGLKLSRVVKITAKMVEMDDKGKYDTAGTRREHSAVCIVEDI